MSAKRTTRSRDGYHWFKKWRTPSPAQRRVLDELVAGGTTLEMAQRIGISEAGVKWHLNELREELELDDRKALSDWWLDHRGRAGFLPLTLLGNLLPQKAAAIAVVIVAGIGSLAVAWLAYSSLAGGDAPDVPAAAAGGSTAPALIPVAPTPTPEPTPVPAGAVVLDIRDASVTPLPGMFFARRWLDTEAGTFVANASGGAVVVDSVGRMTPLPQAASGDSFAAYYPIVNQGEVLIWRVESGELTMVDANAGEVRTLRSVPAFRLGTRDWALTPAGGRLALTDEGRHSITVYELNGDSEQTVFETPAGDAIVHLDWSPDGSRLLVLLGKRLDAGRIGPAERFAVLTASGELILEDSVSARWAGSEALLLFDESFVSGGRGLNGDVLLNLGGGGKSSVADAANLLCVSPDGEAGVFIFEARTQGSNGQRQEVRRLATHELLLTSTSQQPFFNCDWTPDGTRVVLSPGGK